MDAQSSAPPPPIAPPASDGADAPAPNPLIAIAEAHLRMFAELRERGMNITRNLDRRVEMDLQSAEKLIAHQDGADRDLPAPRYPAPNYDAAAMFAKISRALRLTAALEMKTAEKLRALIDGVALEHEARREETARRATAAAEARHEAAKDKVQSLVQQAIFDEEGDGEEVESLLEALDERLEEDDAYMKLEDRPVQEVVEQLSADLALKVDWSRWTGEGWAPRPHPARPTWSQFNTPSRRKIGAGLPPDHWIFKAQPWRNLPQGPLIDDS